MKIELIRMYRNSREGKGFNASLLAKLFTCVNDWVLETYDADATVDIDDCAFVFNVETSEEAQ